MAHTPDLAEECGVVVEVQPQGVHFLAHRLLLKRCNSLLFDALLDLVGALVWGILMHVHAMGVGSSGCVLVSGCACSWGATFLAGVLATVPS